LQEITKTATRRIRKAAEDDGIAIGASYPNYAIFPTPLEEMYGTNVKKLKEIKARVDPSDIMGRAGGFKF
jgi:Berberine and berberine like